MNFVIFHKLISLAKPNVETKKLPSDWLTKGLTWITSYIFRSSLGCLFSLLAHFILSLLPLLQRQNAVDPVFIDSLYFCPVVNSGFFPDVIFTICCCHFISLSNRNFILDLFTHSLYIWTNIGILIRSYL